MEKYWLTPEDIKGIKKDYGITKDKFSFILKAKTVRKQYIIDPKPLEDIIDKFDLFGYTRVKVKVTDKYSGYLERK